MSPRDQIRSDRSRAFRAVPAAVDYDEDDDREVPDLRAKNPLKPPLTKRVKEIATLIGALVAIGGYVLGGGKWALKQADIAKGADIAAAVAPLSESIKTSDAQRATQYGKISESIEEAKAERRALATSLQEIKRTLRRMHAPKDLPVRSTPRHSPCPSGTAGWNYRSMAHEIMDKRANGAGGSGNGRGGSGRPPARNGARETVNLAAKFRDHFDAFVEAGYRTRGLEGIPGAFARRELAERLEISGDLIRELIALLLAEAIDMEAGTKSVADDLPKKNENDPK